MAIQNNYVFEKLDIDTNTESVFAKLTLGKNKTYVIGSVYCPSSSDAVYMEDPCTTIEGIGQRFKNAVGIRRHSGLVKKYNVGLKTLLQQGISKQEFYGDLVYRFKKNCGKI